MSSYVKRILGLVGSRNPVELMRESRVAIEAAMRSIDSSNSFDVAYGDDKWTAREVICHLADVEMAIGFRMRQVLAVDNYTVQPFDEQEWAKAYKTADPRLALRSFLSQRDWNISLLDPLPPSAWKKPYRHPEQGDLTFDILVGLLAGHDINHLSQLKMIEAKSGR